MHSWGVGGGVGVEGVGGRGCKMEGSKRGDKENKVKRLWKEVVESVCNVRCRA